MDKKTFRVPHKQALTNCFDTIPLMIKENAEPEKGKVYLITIEEETTGKTVAQLRGIFGRYAKEASMRYGYTVDEIHTFWKEKFLVDIYRTEPRAGKQQEWVDVLHELEAAEQWEIIEKFVLTVSLSWASVKQAKEYMERIEQFYISINEPLTPIEKQEP